MADLSAHRAREKAQVEANTTALVNQGVAARAAYQKMVEGSAAFRSELEKIKALTFTSDLTGGDNEKVAVNKNDPAVQAALAGLKGKGPQSAAASQAILEGDISKLEAIAKVLLSQASTAPGAATGTSGRIQASAAAAQQAQLIFDTIQALRSAQTGPSAYSPASGTGYPLSTPSGGAVAGATDWDRVAERFADAVVRKTGGGGFGGGGPVKFVLTSEGGRELATIVQRNMARNNINMGRS